MENSITFKDGAQMALWLHIGGKVQRIDLGEDAPILDSEDRPWLDYAVVYRPVGELPDNWCPFQDQIDRRDYYWAFESKEAFGFAKASLLEAADPRLTPQK